MYGWTGTTLRVDLTDGSAKREATNMDVAREYIGARGLGGRVLSDELDHNVDALSPQNKIIFAPGPFSGTFAPTAGRFSVVTKSPLNGTIATSSSGGMFGSEMKYAGYDLIIIEGKASKPVYLWISDDVVEVRDASDLWGLTVQDTTDLVREHTHDEAMVACIGPAGERLSLMASIMNEMHRATGRGGVGAVMGSKNLKAIAVVGSGSVNVADPKAFKASALESRRKIKEHPIGGTTLKAYGTSFLVNVLNKIGALPTRNFQDAYFVTAGKTGGESLAAKQLVRPKGCFACVISCGRVTKVDNPEFAGEGEGPELETAWGFGADCGVDNLDAIIKANYLCNEYGVDTARLRWNDRLCDGALRARVPDSRRHRRHRSALR